MTDGEQAILGVLLDLQSEVAGMRGAFNEQARKFDLLRSCFRDVTLSKREAATYCDCTTRTIDRRVEAGKLFAVPGTSRRFQMEELDRALRAGIL